MRYNSTCFDLLWSCKVGYEPELMDKISTCFQIPSLTKQMSTSLRCYTEADIIFFTLEIGKEILILSIRSKPNRSD